MSKEEYEEQLNAILRRLGGSYGAPSGWAADALFFSCAYPPIVVPHADHLSPEQRELIVLRAEKQYRINLPPE